jgi:hypothetical protein
MNKFLKDDVKEPQIIDEKVMAELFPKFADTPEEVKKRSNSWIVLKSGTTPDGLSYQLVVQDIPNIFYHVFIFELDGSLSAHIPVKAANSFPPVSEKKEGLDYFDWLQIQGAIFNYLDSRGLQPMQLDMSKEDRWAYSTKETPEEINQKIAKNEPYTILAMPIETFLQRFEAYKKKIEDEKSRIILP